MIGCVSVSLKESAPKKATGAKFQNPAEPFQKIRITSGDATWKNKKSGSVISFLSDCDGEKESTLEEIRDDVIQGLSQSQILRERRFKMKDEEALRTSLLCQVDGTDTRIEVAVFNADGCSYVLTLVGRPLSFDSDAPTFEKFISEFEAQ